MRTFIGLFVVAILIAISPVIYYTSIGLYYGYDVVSGFITVFGSNHSGTAIEESKVPSTKMPVRWVGDLENHNLSEASGLAQSNVLPNVFYAINDSGNEPQVFALDDEGRDLGFWRVAVEKNWDWEDLSSFILDGESYLLIADTGDNFNWRPSVEVIVIREPDPESLSFDEVLPVEWRFRIEYPNGYRDCEGVAVDEDSKTVLLLSKRRVPSEVFSVPLRPGKEKVIATRMALLHTIPQPNEQDMLEDAKFGESRSQPTAFEIKGNVAVIFTYKDAYLYTRKSTESWMEAFAKIPTRIPLPETHQQEAGLITRDQDYLYVTTEREDGLSRAGLFQVEL